MIEGAHRARFAPRQTPLKSCLKGDTEMSTHDMETARSTYDTFMGSLKWIVPVIAVIALFVVVAIAP